MQPAHSPNVILPKLAGVLLAVWFVGAAFRLIQPWTPSMFDGAPSMILFAPAVAATLWIGWRPQLALSAVAATMISIVAAFLAWNAIMLPGVAVSMLPTALLDNATHWILFLVVGSISCRYIHWATTIGIWREKARGADCENPPAKLSVLKLLLLTALIAVATIAAIKTMQRFSVTRYTPYSIESFSSLYLQIVPIELKPYLSAVIGGVLLPVQLLAIVFAFRAGTYRIAILFLLLPAMAGIRWLTNEIYWQAPFGFLGADAIESALESGDPLPPYQMTSPPNTSGNYIFEAAVQLGLLLLMVLWFRSAGFRIGFYERLLDGSAPPRCARPSQREGDLT